MCLQPQVVPHEQGLCQLLIRVFKPFLLCEDTRIFFRRGRLEILSYRWVYIIEGNIRFDIIRVLRL